MTKPRSQIKAWCSPIRTMLTVAWLSLLFLTSSQMSSAWPNISGKGVTTTYTYNDHDSLLTDVAYSDSTPAVHYSNFDAYGRCQTMTDGTGTQTFTFDDDDDLTGKTVTYTGLSAKSLSYTFYNDGSRHTMGTPAGTFTYTYDAAGRITGITDPYSTASSWTYYNNDWLSTQALGTAATNSYTYNAAGQVTAQNNTATVSGTTFNFGSFHYDGVGNLLGYTATSTGAAAAGTYSYGYDTKDEVTSDQFVPTGGGTAFNRTYAYDGAGNPTTFRGQTGLTFNSDNQPTGTTLTFDGDGNTTFDGGSAVTWNGADQMTSWGSETSIKYDGFGLRASRVHSSATQYLLYDGDTPVCDLDGSGNVLQTVTMGPTGMAHLHSTAYGNAMLIDDPRGNGVQTINASGTVTNAAAVDAYGQTGSNAAGLFDYQDTYPTGQFGAGPNAIPLDFRDYDTSTGRMMSRDPIGYAGGINLYSYTANNPVNRSDPSGLNWANGDLTEGDIPTSMLQTRDLGMVQAGLCADQSILNYAAEAASFLVGGPEEEEAFAAAENAEREAAELGQEERELAQEAEEVEQELAQEGCLFCFVAGTPVQMADGSTKPIEQVKRGDLVKSRDPQTGKPVAERVVQTFHRQSEALVSVTVKDSQSGQTETFQCSPDHPFYVPGEGWMAAGELAQGSSITSRAGPKLSVVSVSWQRQTPADLSAGASGYTVYNFEVEKTHTYFVGTEDGGTWVHNDCPWASVDDLPAEERQAVNDAMSHMDSGSRRFPSWARGGKWGARFRNRVRQGQTAPDLPGVAGAGGYKEYYVRKAPGTSGWGLRRIVKSITDSKVYYTWTHYGDAGDPPFVRIR